MYTGLARRGSEGISARQYLNDVVCVAHAVRCAWPVGLQLVAWEPLAVPPAVMSSLHTGRQAPAGRALGTMWTASFKNS